MVSTLGAELNCEDIICLDDKLIKESKTFIADSTFTAKVDDTERCLDEGTVEEFEMLFVASSFTKELNCGENDAITCCLDDELVEKIFELFMDATSIIG